MYQQGYNAALQQLGLEKIAVAGMMSRFMPKLKSFGSAVATNLVGKPKQFLNELRSGTAFDKDSLIAEGFKAPKLWQKAVMYGLPAASAVQTLRSDDPDKAGSIGGLIGGTVLSTAAFGPFGMLGALPASMGGEFLGKRLVRGTQRILGVGNQQAPQYTSLQQPQSNIAAAQLPGLARRG
jgi:hypothetical protein